MNYNKFDDTDDLKVDETVEVEEVAHEEIQPEEKPQAETAETEVDATTVEPEQEVSEQTIDSAEAEPVFLDERGIEDAFDEGDPTVHPEQPLPGEDISPEGYELIRQRKRKHLMIWLISAACFLVLLIIILGAVLGAKNRSKPIEDSRMRIEQNDLLKYHAEKASNKQDGDKEKERIKDTYDFQSGGTTVIYCPTSTETVKGSIFANDLSYENKEGQKINVSLVEKQKDGKRKKVSKIELNKYIADEKQKNKETDFVLYIWRKATSEERKANKVSRYENELKFIINFRKMLFVFDEDNNLKLTIDKKDFNAPVKKDVPNKYANLKSKGKPEEAIPELLGYTKDDIEYYAYNELYTNKERYEVVENPRTLVDIRNESKAYASLKARVLSNLAEDEVGLKLVFTKLKKDPKASKELDNIYTWAYNHIPLSEDAIQEIEAYVQRPNNTFAVEKEWNVQNVANLKLTLGADGELDPASFKLSPKTLKLGNAENNNERIYKYVEVNLIPNITKVEVVVQYYYEASGIKTQLFVGSQDEEISFDQAQRLPINTTSYDLKDPIVNDDIKLPEDEYFSHWIDEEGKIYYLITEDNKNPENPELTKDLKLTAVTKEYTKIYMSLPHPAYRGEDLVNPEAGDERANLIISGHKDYEKMEDILKLWKTDVYATKFQKLVRMYKFSPVGDFVHFARKGDLDTPVNLKITVNDKTKDMSLEEYKQTYGDTNVFVRLNKAFYTVNIEDQSVDDLSVFNKREVKNDSNIFYEEQFTKKDGVMEAKEPSLKELVKEPDASEVAHKKLKSNYEIQIISPAAPIAADGSSVYDVRFVRRQLPVLVHKYENLTPGGVEETLSNKIILLSIVSSGLGVVELGKDKNPAVPHEYLVIEKDENNNPIYYTDSTLRTKINFNERITSELVKTKTDPDGKEYDVIEVHAKFVKAKGNIKITIQFTSSEDNQTIDSSLNQITEYSNDIYAGKTKEFKEENSFAKKPDSKFFEFVPDRSKLEYNINHSNSFTSVNEVVLVYKRKQEIKFNVKNAYNDKNNSHLFEGWYEGTIKNLTAKDEDGSGNTQYKKIDEICIDVTKDGIKYTFVGVRQKFANSTSKIIDLTELKQFPFTKLSYEFEIVYEISSPIIKIHLVKSDVATNQKVTKTPQELASDEFLYMVYSNKELGDKYALGTNWKKIGSNFITGNTFDFASTALHDELEGLRQYLSTAEHQGYYIDDSESSTWKATNVQNDNTYDVVINLYRKEYKIEYKDITSTNVVYTENYRTGKEVSFYTPQSSDDFGYDKTLSQLYCWSSGDVKYFNGEKRVLDGSDAKNLTLVPTTTDINNGFISVMFVLADLTNKYDSAVDTSKAAALFCESVGEYNGTKVLMAERKIIGTNSDIFQYDPSTKIEEFFGIAVELDETAQAQVSIPTEYDKTKEQYAIYYLKRKEFTVNFVHGVTDQFIEINKSTGQTSQTFIYGTSLKDLIIPDYKVELGVNGKPYKGFVEYRVNHENQKNTAQVIDFDKFKEEVLPANNVFIFYLPL